MVIRRIQNITAEKNNCYNSQPCVHLTALAETQQMRSALIRWFPGNKPARMEKKVTLIYIFTVTYKNRKSYYCTHFTYT